MEGSSDRLKRALDDLIYLPSLRDSGGEESAEAASRSPLRLAALSSPPGSRDKAPSEPAKCRPWDRADLMRRLQTFRAGTWFGKPAALKPAPCASRGWINVGMDTLKCEFCSARLICDLPQGNTQDEQYQQLVSRYSQRLDEAHTACCPWRGNTCSEWLMQFPSLGRDVLLEQYTSRLQALSRVEGLPNLKNATLDRMLSVAKKGTGISKALSAASPLEAGASKAQRRSAVQRAIALCGWEVQVPGYSVGTRSSNTRAAGGTGAQRSSSSPSVSLTSLPGAQQLGGSPSPLSLERVSGAGPPLESQGVVLCCPMCAARAGLWNYTLHNEAARPLWHTNLVSPPRAPVAALATPPVASGSAATAAGGGGGSSRLRPLAPAEGAPGGFTPPPQKQPPRIVQMALSRTLGGGDLDALREASSSSAASPSKGTHQNSGTAARAVKMVSSSPLVPVFGTAATQAPAFGSTAPAFGSPVQAAAPRAEAAGSQGATYSSAPEDSSKRRRLDSVPTATPTPSTPSAVPTASTTPPEAEGLDPIALHRPFCPWVNGAAGASKSGWVQVLEALSAPPPGLGGVEQPEEDFADGPPVDVYTKRFMSALFDL